MNILQAFLGKPAQPMPDPVTQPLLDQITETLGAEIAAMPADRQHLTLAISRARRYFEDLADALPGPVNLYLDHYEQDPLLDRLFSSPEEIWHALGRSMEMKEALPKLFFGGRPYPYAYGLLGMRRRPVQGEALPVFADHTLAFVSPSEEDVRGRLADAGFSRILKAFDEHILRLKQKERLLKSEWNIENKPGMATAGQDEYVHADQELTPDNMLKGLMAWLGRPEEHLRLAREKSAFVTTPGNGHPPLRLELPTLHSADRRQWLVCIAKFPTQDALEAGAQESHPHRYIFV
jgi:hypothetical protein